MTYTLKLTERFKALHALAGIVDESHLHEWVIEIQIKAETLSPPGLAVNYFELKQILDDLLPTENADLNDLYPVAPTAENLSKYFYEVLEPKLPTDVTLQSVAVGEFPEFMCYYQP